MRDQDASSGGTDDPVELLSQPPTDDDLDDLLRDAAPRRRSRLTLALVAGLIFVMGFFLGSTAEKVAVSIREAQTAAAGESDEDGAVSGSGPAAFGRVVMIEDGVLYVERLDGATLKVRVSEATVVGRSEPGEMGDLSPGDTVIVVGQIAEDGSVDASSIQQSRPAP